MRRTWEVVVEEVVSLDPKGVAIIGQDCGSLVVSGDTAEIHHGDAVVSAPWVSRTGLSPSEYGSFGYSWIFLRSVSDAQVAVGDRIVGGGPRPSRGRPFRLSAWRTPRDPRHDEELVRMSWRAAGATAVRGSSGDWTASLEYLPMSFGGARTERKALDGLLRAHEEALRDAAYRAAALRIVMRSQGREPIGEEKPS